MNISTNIATKNNVNAMDKALEDVLQAFTGGDRTKEEETLVFLKKVLERKGVMKGFEFFYHLNPDGFLIGYGSNEGFEDADERISGFHYGYHFGRKTYEGQG